MKKRILPPEILIEETFKEFGYRPNKISPLALVPVVARCSYTGEIHRPILRRIWSNRTVKETGHYLSQRGALLKMREGKTTIPTTRRFVKAPLPDNVSIELTLLHYGYDPRDLGVWSKKYLITKCEVSGDKFRVRRDALNYSKSVRDKGRHTANRRRTKGKG